MKVKPVIDLVDPYNYLASENHLIYWLNQGIETRNTIVESCSLIAPDLSITGEIPSTEDFEIITDLDQHIQETIEYLNLYCRIGD